VHIIKAFPLLFHKFAVAGDAIELGLLIKSSVNLASLKQLNLLH